MAAYNFKRDAKVYIVYGGNQYNIDISEITFSQTIMEESHSVKTIQSGEMFEGSIIRKANPANFSFTFPALREADLEIVFDRALDYSSFDLYVDTNTDIFYIRNCVIGNATFIVEKLRPLSMTVSGEASQVSTAGSVLGTPVSRSVLRTYNRVTDIVINLDSTDITDFLTAVTIELQNDINWTPYTTLDAVCGVSGSIVYPENYTINKRILAGTVTTYITDTNTADLQSWGKDLPLYIEVGQKISSTIYGFKLDISNCFFTNRVGSGQVFTQSYDWRMTQAVTDLSTIVTYTTL
jgi:hypothetical protein